MWHVKRDDETGLVLVAADYELLTNDEARALARAISDVAGGRVYYVDQGGSRDATWAEYEGVALSVVTV